MLPWMAGAGFAISHIVVSSHCTLPQQGRCSSCGGCVVALTAIVAWAVYSKRQGNGIFGSGKPRL